MVQDEAGDWWAVGTQSGAWQRFDGSSWVPGAPPGRAGQGSAAAGPIRVQGAPSEGAKARSGWAILGCGLLRRDGVVPCGGRTGLGVP